METGGTALEAKSRVPTSRKTISAAPDLKEDVQLGEHEWLEGEKYYKESIQTLIQRYKSIPKSAA